MAENSVFYIVSDEYIAYLLKIERHVMQNKPEERTYHRKYVGILTCYMKNKDKLYGTLRFNSMIPVPESELSEYKINDEGDFSYKMLMLAEYNFCKDNFEKIEKTAKNLYEKKCHSSDADFPIGKIVIDFKKVEKACIEYK